MQSRIGGSPWDRDILETDERAYDPDIHLDGALASKDAGKHRHPFLSEHIGQRAPKVLPRWYRIPRYQELGLDDGQLKYEIVGKPLNVPLHLGRL